MRLNETIAKLKGGPSHGPPPERCLRCGDVFDYTAESVTLEWSDGLPGGRHPAETDLVGGLCGQCLAELAEEWSE